MGGRIETREVVSFVRDENSNLLLDGSATTIFGYSVEDSLGNGFIREENHSLDHLVYYFEDNLNSWSGNGEYSIGGWRTTTEDNDTVLT